MSDCCSSSSCKNEEAGKHSCPVNGKAYAPVSKQTVMQHLRAPWLWQPQQMYFCDDPECSVVYFGEDDSILTADALRTAVGIKDESEQATVCYCFGVTRGQAAKTPELKTFVIEQTRKRLCACEVRNPSGKCCLKDFPKAH